ncbi:hypothetical protein ZWY2020_006907 [Hordeum vulgare]|nr:hypothetical protein ZWY2020_006907 [Hordeum vulgare]
MPPSSAAAARQAKTRSAAGCRSGMGGAGRPSRRAAAGRRCRWPAVQGGQQQHAARDVAVVPPARLRQLRQPRPTCACRAAAPPPRRSCSAASPSARSVTKPAAVFSCRKLAAPRRPTDLLLVFLCCCRQVDYILGNNPLRMSYMVGYGERFPRRIHHRGSSLPSRIGCKAGAAYYGNSAPNPNLLVGAVVGGPSNTSDNFPDARAVFQQSEPTAYINALLLGLLAYFSTHPNLPLMDGWIDAAVVAGWRSRGDAARLLGRPAPPIPDLQPAAEELAALVCSGLRLPPRRAGPAGVRSRLGLPRRRRAAWPHRARPARPAQDGLGLEK